MAFQIRGCAAALVAGLILSSCQTAKDAFIGDRLQNLCDEAYWICSRPSQCVLAEDEFTAGGFPGVRRVTIPIEEENETIEIRFYFETMESPGTELEIALYDPDCLVNKNHGVIHVEDTDIFEEAGDDRTLTYRLQSFRPGEHLLEIYSDASAAYLLIVDRQ